MEQLTRHQPAIHSFLTSLMPGDPNIDDVLQQANLTMWRKRGDFAPGTNFRAWAFECAKWTMRAHFKEKQRKSWLLVDEGLTQAITDGMLARLPDSPSAGQAALRQCLGKLRESDRDLLISYYEEGRSLGECSKQTGRSASSLKVALFRLRAVLRRCITANLAKA